MSKFAPHGRSTNQPRPTSSTICQKCLKSGHFIYECKSTRPYISRPTRTQQLENPRVLAKLKSEGKPSMDVPEEFLKSGTANKILEGIERERLKLKTDTDEGSSKKRARASSPSSSDSSSNSDSSSESDSDSASGSDSNSSQSRERDRKRRRPTRRHSRSLSTGSDASRGRRT